MSWSEADVVAEIKPQSDTWTDADVVNHAGMEHALNTRERTTVQQEIGNLIAGGVRGTTSVPLGLYGLVNKKDAKSRKQAIDQVMQDLGANPNAGSYALGKTLSEVAGTAGTGGLLAKGAQAAKLSAPIVNSLNTWGMRTGLEPKGLLQHGLNLGLKSGAGAIDAGVSSAIIDPEHAGTGALIGAAIPTAVGIPAFVGSKVWQSGKNIIAGKEGQAINYLNEIFGNQQARQKVANRLLATKALSSGEMPTAGIAAVSDKELIPALKALEEGARSRPEMAQEFVNRDAANQAALVSQLEKYALPGRPLYDAETGNVISAIEAERRAVTNPLYKIAGKDMVQISPELDSALQNAQLSTLYNKAEKSADQAVANMRAGGNNASISYEPAFIPQGAGMLGVEPKTPFIPRDTSYSIAALQRVKDELSGRIAGLQNATDNASIVERSQLKDARRLLTNQMKGQSGTYSVANDVSKNYYNQQNIASIADELLKSLESPAGVQRKAAYLAAMDNSPKILNKAGVTEFNDIRQVIPQNIMSETINQIGRAHV